VRRRLQISEPRSSDSGLRMACHGLVRVDDTRPYPTQLKGVSS
jgi:hypothetical protein